jgi:GNAT superfamily N-acetyltransferase
VAATAQRIRTADDADVPRVIEVLRRAGFAGEGIVRLVEYPRVSPTGTILVAEDETGALAGVACCASFGATGWIGALGVVPGARRRGLGAALTEAAAGWLQDRGASTVLLYATEMGRPVYERLGFEHDGPATAWRGVAGTVRPRDGLRLRPLAPDDAAAVRAVDALATGEDRRAVLDTLRAGTGTAAVDAEGVLRGWAATSPWGAGAAISAEDPAAGIALLAAVAAGPVPATIVVPDGNADARRALRGWGFARLNDAARMRLGDPIAWRPECQFGLWNLFWG